MMKKILFISAVLAVILVVFYSQWANNSLAAPAVQALAQKTIQLPIAPIPSLDTSRLSASQLDQLRKILDEEMCPCGTPVSFAQCLPVAAQCQPAILFGQWLADRLADGLSESMLAEVATKEIGGGFSSKAENIVIAGFARKGAVTPKIRIVEFADFQCVHCRAATKNLHIFAKKYPNEIEVLFKHFPLPGHPMAMEAAYAAEAAGMQGKFWDMLDALFANQNNLDRELISGLVRALNLNSKKFEKDIASAAVKNRVAQSVAEAKRLGLSGTPSFFFNSRQYHLSFDLSGFELRRQMELARRNTNDTDSKKRYSK